MRYLVQDSVDNGKTWRPVYLAGQPLEFKSKADAKAWFASFEEANNIDWRVFFLIRCRDGKHFRLVTKKTGEEVVR